MEIIRDRDLADFIARQESMFVRGHEDYLGLVDNIEDGVETITGDTLPWAKTHNCFRFRPKEVTLYAGIGGSGKSLLSGQLALDLVTRGRKVLIASLEMPPERTLHRMRQQFACEPKTNPDQRKAFADLEGIYIYDQTGRVEAERIIGLLHYAGHKLGVDYVLIDSLFKVGLDTRKGQDQTPDFLDALTWAAKTHAMHIILIHHLRKGDDTSDVPNGFDVRGCSELRDAPDNVLLHWKNGKKLDARNNGETVSASEPDALLIVDKQRHGDWVGRIKLYFHHPSHQHIEEPFVGYVRRYA